MSLFVEHDSRLYLPALICAIKHGRKCSAASESETFQNVCFVTIPHRVGGYNDARRAGEF